MTPVIVIITTKNITDTAIITGTHVDSAGGGITAKIKKKLINLKKKTFI